MPPPLPVHAVRLAELDAARAEPSAGLRLHALRRAGRVLRDRLLDAGPAIGVRTTPLATLPHPARHALGGLARSPAPLVVLQRAMQIVQVDGPDGGVVTVVVNPFDLDRAREAPALARALARFGGDVAGRLLARRLGSLEGALAEAGLAPDDVDYVAFDHLELQDVRGLLGTTAPEPGRRAPTAGALPRARLLIQRAELRALADRHPLQAGWYVADAIRGVPPDRLVALDGDHLVGPGLALIATPGRTEGHQTIVVATERGLWTIGASGVCVDAYAPHVSAIPGLRRAARDGDLEVVVDAGARASALDQYTSMVLDKTLADPSAERPEFPQHFPSAELVPSRLSPGIAPTFRHGRLSHGRLRPSFDLTNRRSGPRAAAGPR